MPVKGRRTTVREMVTKRPGYADLVRKWLSTIDLGFYYRLRCATGLARIEWVMATELLAVLVRRRQLRLDEGNWQSDLGMLRLVGSGGLGRLGVCSDRGAAGGFTERDWYWSARSNPLDQPHSYCKKHSKLCTCSILH